MRRFRVMRFNPFKEFEEFPWKRLLPLVRFEREPFLDVFETDKEVVVTAELPGVRKEDLKLRVSSKGLSIKVAEKEKHEEEKREKGFYRYEYSTHFQGYNEFVSFPCEVDAKRAQASLKNGVLEVRAPKKEGAVEGRELKIE